MVRPGQPGQLQQRLRSTTSAIQLVHLVLRHGRPDCDGRGAMTKKFIRQSIARTRADWRTYVQVTPGGRGASTGRRHLPPLTPSFPRRRESRNVLNRQCRLCSTPWIPAFAGMTAGARESRSVPGCNVAWPQEVLDSRFRGNDGGGAPESRSVPGCNVAWPQEVLDSRFRGNDGVGAGMTGWVRE